MKPKNKYAVALGKLAKGHAKTLTDAERERRRIAAANARLSRWVKKTTE